MTSNMCDVCGEERDSVKAARLCAASHASGRDDDDAPKSGPAVKAPELLGRAAALMFERGKDYDKPAGERSMGRVVDAFNAITGRDLTESEGWLLMTVLKQVRGFTRSGFHVDSFDDLIAYSALMAEARAEGR